MTLKEFRLSKKLTQKEMAEKLGLSKSMIEKLEYNQARPSIETIEKFEEVFKDFNINIFLNKNHK